MTATYRSDVDQARRTIRRLEKRATATRVVSALVLLVIALSASQQCHVLAVSLACLVVLVVVLIIGIPTQVRLIRARRALTSMLQAGSPTV